MAETNLIRLPTGTDRRGLHLKPPHGALIADGIKTQIAKAKPFDLSGPWILVSGGMAYGTMEVGLPEPLGVEEFDRRFGEHRVTKSERKKWWTDNDTLYLSPITDFEPFKKAAQIHVIPGMQTVVETVGFKGTEPDLSKHYEQVRLVIEAIEPEGKAIETEHTAEETDKAIEAVEELTEAAALPQHTEDTQATASKEENPMPYDPKKPPKKVEGMPEKAQRIWVHAYNSAAEKYPDDTARCHKIAYGAVKNAGYYQDDEGSWSKKELGEGIGVGDPRQGVGGTDVCVCPSCGHEMEHERGTPCAETECPKCGAAMTGVIVAKEPKVMLKPRPNDEAFNIDDYTNRIRRAWDASRAPPPRDIAVSSWVTEVWDEFVIVEIDNVFYRVSYYETGDGELVFADRSEWQKVEKETMWLDSEAGSKGVLAWLKEKFDSILGDLRGQPEKLGITFKAADGRVWFLTWTTNAFVDSEGEIFRTKALEEYVDAHVDDEVKGEFWFWHLPGMKMGEIRWQAIVGRFLVEAGPSDDTPIGRKMAEFFSQHPHNHPKIAPEGWGTSHTYYYVQADREDKIYDWLDKFETTVLPKSAASNKHSPRMEVLSMSKMTQPQKDALTEIAGDDGEFVEMVIKTGLDRTKELEALGIAFKDTAAEEVAVVEVKPKEEAQEAEETEAQETEETKGAEPTAAGEEEADSQIKALAQQIVAGLNLGEIAQAIKSVQDTVGTIAGNQEEQDKRLKALEDIGGEQAAPLIPLPRAAYWQASRVAQTEPDEKLADKAQPKVPDAISEMAKRIPI